VWRRSGWSSRALPTGTAARQQEHARERIPAPPRPSRALDPTASPPRGQPATPMRCGPVPPMWRRRPAAEPPPTRIPRGPPGAPSPGRLPDYRRDGRPAAVLNDGPAHRPAAPLRCTTRTHCGRYARTRPRPGAPTMDGRESRSAARHQSCATLSRSNLRIFAGPGPITTASCAKFARRCSLTRSVPGTGSAERSRAMTRNVTIV
jgi:hypothetical protein